MTKDIQTRQRTEISEGSFDSFAPLASQSLFWRARYVAPSPMLGALPLLFWLSENIRPRIGVTIGLDDPVGYFALCQAVQTLGLDAMCFGIASEDTDVASLTDYNSENYPEFSQILRMGHGPAADLLEDGEIDLLIVTDPADMPLQDDLDMYWLPRMSDSGAILFLAGGDSLAAYCDRISQDAGYFTLDREKGICVALCGTGHNDRLRRLCQLRIGRPGYGVVRNVFTRIGELHDKTVMFDELTRETRTAHRQIETLEDRLATQTRGLEQARQDLAQAEQTLARERDAARTKEHEAGAALATAREQNEKTQARLAESESARTTAEQRSKALTRARDNAMNDAETARHDLSALTGKFEAVSRDLDTQAQDIASLTGERDAARQQIEALTGEMQALRKTADEAARQTEERFNDIALLGLELQKVETELQEARDHAKSQAARLAHGVQDDNDTRATLRGEMDGKQHELNDLRGQIEVLRDILRETEGQRDEARHRVSDLERSTSWKVTSPLRRASLMVRRKE